MTAQTANRGKVSWPRATILIAATLASPFVLYVCDRGLLHTLGPDQSWLVDIAIARLPSFAVCGLLFAFLARPFLKARLDCPSSVRLTTVVGIVAVAVTVAGVFAGAFSPYLPGLALLGFLVFGLLAEEFLFRGVVFEALTSLTPFGPAGAVVGSAVLFSLSHFGYHDFRLTPEALQQVTYTLPMGLAFGYLRARTGRMAPGALVHLAINLSGLAATALTG